MSENNPSPEPNLVGWIEIPDEIPHALLKSINRDNQVLAYENGRYYNAWFEFEPSEGGWFWTDDADTEPNPSHYRMLREVAFAATEGRQAMTDVEVEQWINACNHEPARETLRHYLALRSPSPETREDDND